MRIRGPTELDKPNLENKEFRRQSQPEEPPPRIEDFLPSPPPPAKTHYKSPYPSDDDSIMAAPRSPTAGPSSQETAAASMSELDPIPFSPEMEKEEVRAGIAITSFTNSPTSSPTIPPVSNLPDFSTSKTSPLDLNCHPVVVEKRKHRLLLRPGDWKKAWGSYDGREKVRLIPGGGIEEE